MTRTKSQKLRAAASRKGPSQSTTTSSPKSSSSGSKGRKAKGRTGKGMRQKKGDIPLARGHLSNNGRAGIRGMDSAVVDVEQWLTAVNTGIQTGAKVLQSYYLNPQSFVTAGRMARYASLFERYQFESFEAHYQPNVAATNQGSLFLALDMDPEDSLTQLTGMTLMNAVTALGPNHKDFDVCYEDLTVRASGKTDFPLPLFVDADKNGDRQAYAGRLVIGTVSAFPTSIEAGFVTIKARIRFSVPALELGGVSEGFENSWNISSPSGSHPWGTAVTPSSRNNLDVILGQINPLGGSFSTLTFNSAGVFQVEWFSTGSALTTGTVTFGGGASAVTSGDAWNVGKHLTPSAQTEDIGYYTVNVPQSGGWMSYSNSGTHSNSATNFIRVYLTPYPNTNVTPAPLDATLLDLKESISALKAELFAMKMSATNGVRLPVLSVSKSKASPLVVGDIYETEGESSSEGTGSVETFNGPSQLTSNSVTAISASETEQIGGPALKASALECDHRWVLEGPIQKILGGVVQRARCSRCQSQTFENVE